MSPGRYLARRDGCGQRGGQARHSGSQQAAYMSVQKHCSVEKGESQESVELLLVSVSDIV